VNLGCEGELGTIPTSSGVTTWTSRSSGTSNTLSGVTYTEKPLPKL